MPGPVPRGRSLTPVAIVALYAMMALFYILWSDRLLGGFARTPEALTRLQSVKGVVFVALTSSLLYALLRRWMGQMTRAHEAERDQHALLGAVVHNTTDAVFIQDLDGRFLLANGPGARLIGRASHEVVGRTEGELVPEPLASRLAAARQAVMKNGAPRTIEIETESGSSRFWLLTYSPYRLDDGRIAGAVCVARDVSERARADQLLEEQEALLHQAQKMEAVGRLAGGLAHDFNNLLTIITSSAELLESSMSRDDARRDDIGEIRRASERAAVLVRELLAFSSQQLLQPAVLDLHDVLADARHSLARTVTAHVRLHLESRPGECIVKADKRQLELALINLAVNARDAMPRGGTLSISAGIARLDHGRMLVDAGQHVAAGAYAVLRIRDTGHGIDPATRARLFEPFFSTKSATVGSGLGLAVVYGIVAQSGGFIEVDSEPGRGTEFRVYLPLAERQDAEPVEADAFDPRGERSTVVLVAEDEDVVRRLARRILEREGFTVIEARDGEEALELCAVPGRRIDLVLSDVVMPRLGGRELVDRCLAQFPGCRALLMSGYTDDELVRRDVLDSRAVFLAKPFTPDALLRKVREALELPVAT